MSDSLRPHESQHARPPCPSPTPGVYSNSCPSSQWCHPAISSSVVPFSSCPQSLPASGSFPTSQLFAWGGQSIGVSASASVLPMNTQDWSPLGWTGWISLQSKGLSRGSKPPQMSSGIKRVRLIGSRKQQWGLPRWHSDICLPMQEMQKTWVRSLGQEDPLEKEMATYSSNFVWEILWTEGPGWL